MDRKFHTLQEYFARHDMELIKKKGSRVFDTTHGIFGVSGLDELFTFFKEIHLEKESSFLDLGSGDGRVVFLASLFTKAAGIEADPELHAMALQAKKDLEKDIPELSRCELIKGDYTEASLPPRAVFFTYIDHAWPLLLEQNLIATGGNVYSYQNLFAPELLEKGKTFWAGQTSIVHYLCKRR